MDRHWLLTSTTYGNWLPGDARGFVSEYRGTRRKKILDNIPGTPYAKDMPELQEYARIELKGPHTPAVRAYPSRPPRYETGNCSPSESWRSTCTSSSVSWA